MKDIFENWREYLNENQTNSHDEDCSCEESRLQLICETFGLDRKSKNLLNEIQMLHKTGILNSRRRRGEPQFLVIHHSVTKSPESTFRVLKRKGISIHFEVDKAGTVHKYVDPSRVAYHSLGKNVNAKSIGIEITHLGGSMTGEQHSSLRKLVTHLCSTYNIPQVTAPDGVRFNGDTIPKEIGIARHRNFRATGCPGRWDFDSLGTPYDGDINIVNVNPDKNNLKPGDVVQGFNPGSRGRFLRSYKDFSKRHPNFDFNAFYKEIGCAESGRSCAALPKHGKDYVFGPEHMEAWMDLQKKKSQGPAAITGKEPEKKKEDPKTPDASSA